MTDAELSQVNDVIRKRAVIEYLDDCRSEKNYEFSGPVNQPSATSVSHSIDMPRDMPTQIGPLKNRANENDAGENRALDISDNKTSDLPGLEK